MQFHLEGLTAEPLHPVVPSLITSLFDKNGRLRVNIGNRLKNNQGGKDKFKNLMGKMDDNNVTVHAGENLKPTYVQNGELITHPEGITSGELEEFEALYSDILDKALTPEEQKVANKLMKRLNKNGGYVRVSQEGTVQVNWRGNFTSKERNRLRQLQQKRINALREHNINPTFNPKLSPPKPTTTKTPPIIEKPSPVDSNPDVWSPEEEQELEDLMAKLDINGGRVIIKGGKVRVEAGGFKGITHSELTRLEELHNKRLKIKKAKPTTKPKPTKPKKKTKPVQTTKQSKASQQDTQELHGTHFKPRLTSKEVEKMSFKELADYYEVDYKGLVKYDYDGREYHTFVETLSDGSTLEIKMEKGAIKSYAKGGVASPQEIIQEVLRVPEENKINTDRIWFKNTQQGINHKFTKTGYDSLDQRTLGYNSFYSVDKKGLPKGPLEDVGGVIDAPCHEIVINPRHFKTTTIEQEGKIVSWKHTIRHEFMHSSDTTRKRFDEGLDRLCMDEEFREIEREEKYFTDYGNSCFEESFAEHGGYVSSMLDNPEDQMKTIEVTGLFDEEVGWETKEINFEEYKEMYPKHYAYFKKLILGE